jgi:hypothetical protein
MSSLAVRTAFRTEFATWCAAHSPAISFYDTINKSVKPTTDFWITLSFFATGTQRLNFCNTKEETGYCEAVLFCKAGIGDNDVLTVADEIATDFINFKAGSIIVDDIDAPIEYTSGEAKQGQYGVSMFLNYSNIN